MLVIRFEVNSETNRVWLEEQKAATTKEVQRHRSIWITGLPRLNLSMPIDWQDTHTDTGRHTDIEIHRDTHRHIYIQDISYETLLHRHGYLASWHLQLVCWIWGTYDDLWWSCFLWLAFLVFGIWCLVGIDGINFVQNVGDICTQTHMHWDSMTYSHTLAHMRTYMLWYFDIVQCI